MRSLDRRTRTFLDVIVVTWCALWLVVGYVIDREVLGLRKLSDTVVIAGQALDSTAEQLHAFGSLPLVGARAERAAQEAHRAAVSARFSGRESRHSITNVAHWLWFAVSAIGILPILLVYGLIRFPVRREL
jgi:hypothetical protein